jgi:hypothetical protein
MASFIGLAGRGRPSAPLAAALGQAAIPERPLVFLDLEASSLGPRSWPIEIGCAWLEAGQVEVRSELIAPRPEWPLDDWSLAAQRCHGLSLAQVRRGQPADALAAATDALAGCEVVSDNPRWDQFWLDRLRAGRRERIVVRHVRDAAATRLPGLVADAFALALLRSVPPHRAGGDARRLAEAWLGALRRYELAG